MRPLGDRRAATRFEVVGAPLWATMSDGRPVRIINLSPAGALISLTVPPPLDSLQTIEMIIDGNNLRLPARVRHVSLPAGVDQRGDYGVGLEFMETSSLLVQALERAHRRG